MAKEILFDSTVHLMREAQVHVLFEPESIVRDVFVMAKKDGDGTLRLTIRDTETGMSIDRVSSGVAKRALTYPVAMSGCFITRHSLGKLIKKAKAIYSGRDARRQSLRDAWERKMEAGHVYF